MRSCDPNTSVDQSELFISNLSMLMIGISDIRPMRVRPLSKHCCVHRPQLRCWLPALKSSDLDSQQQRPPGSDRSRKTFATSCHLEFSILHVRKKKQRNLKCEFRDAQKKNQPCNISHYSLTRTSAICEKSSKALTIPRMTCQSGTRWHQAR